MEITEVKVFLVGEEKLRAFVSIVLDRCFMINDIKVIQGRDGLFVSMPSRRKKNGDFKDVAHPLNNPTRSWLEDRVLSEYRVQLEAHSNGDRASRPPIQGRIGNLGESPEAAVSPGLADRLEEVRQEHLSDDFWSVDSARVANRSS